jgi:hypothetical protein
MRWISSRLRVAAAASARRVGTAVGMALSVSLIDLGALPALGAEPSAPSPGPAAITPAAAKQPRASETAGNDALLLIQQRLVPFQTLQGRFEQQKRIAKLKKPLASRGRFALLRGRGVLWRTEAPIQSLLTLTSDAMTVEQHDQTIVSISLAREPALRFLGQSVFAVFMTDVPQLRQSFTVLDARVPESPAPWSLSLVPRDAAAAQLMRQIALTGGEQIESIEISERNGDGTLIRLLDVDRTTALRADDARLLARTPGKP